MNFKYDDTKLTVAYTLALLIAASLTILLVTTATAVLVTVVLGFAGVFALLLNVYRTRSIDDTANKEHIQALMYVLSSLNLQAPLPMLTGWAVSPQLAATLIRLVRENEPRLIVELGSGSSTLIMGYVTEELDRGEVIALDHLKEYVGNTKTQIDQHGLGDRATVLHAPLTDVEVDGTSWPWYDLSVLDEDVQIDMLLVDGPPHKTRPLARFPALPLLASCLSDETTIVLDDAYRDDESEIVRRWQAQFPEFEVQIEDSPYGTAVFHRTSR